MVDLVLVGGVFWLRCNSLVVSVWKYVRDGLIGKAESDMWVTKTLEFAQAKLKKKLSKSDCTVLIFFLNSQTILAKHCPKTITL